MEISEVKIFPVNEEKLKAFVSVIFDRCFMVNDIKVIQGKDSLFISMPSRRKRNGEFKDVAHPLNNETRRWMEERILGEYKLVVAGEQAEGVSAPLVASVPSPVPAGSSLAPMAPTAPTAPTAPNGALPVHLAGFSPTALPIQPLASDERSLEEVEELHLRDSFWSVP
jgi:stage V sporulation protein G